MWWVVFEYSNSALLLEKLLFRKKKKSRSLAEGKELQMLYLKAANDTGLLRRLHGPRTLLLGTELVKKDYAHLYLVGVLTLL